MITREDDANDDQISLSLNTKLHDTSYQWCHLSLLSPQIAMRPNHENIVNWWYASKLGYRTWSHNYPKRMKRHKSSQAKKLRATVRESRGYGKEPFPCLLCYLPSIMVLAWTRKICKESWAINQSSIHPMEN